MAIKFNDFLKDELTIVEIQKALDQGVITSKELVMYYLHRIAKFDQSGPKLNSVLEINPDAIFIAEALDFERKASGARGALHGIPILLKDNIETHDSMHTSAGTLALSSHIAAKDAFLVEKLRKAGAILLGKTNMTELANGMSSEMWAGYSSRGGQVFNPYGGRSLFVGGSSSGSAVSVAANFSVGSIGTETDASILSPAIQNSVVGIKPTVGLISRRGIIPFSYSQDTAGPFARNVADAVLLLDVLAGVDESDPATHKYKHIPGVKYSDFLDASGLKGARIGIFIDATEAFLLSDEYDGRLYNDAIQTLKDQGAIIVENVDIPSFSRNWSWGVSLYELKHSLDNYLAQLSPLSPVHSIKELIEFNEEIGEEALKYGQDKLKQRVGLSNTLSSPDYLNSKLEDLYFSQEQGIDFTLKKYNLDAILFPSYTGSTISAKAGYPSIAVPAGYKKSGRPFGITFAGTAFSEGVLIKIAYAYEQATKHRQAPQLKP
ncbi:amidase family protein [Ureibacillus aquaedulcis]|uniref:Amidase family protein n=1 Tax=Ureibacillus aquaedulcis TaxID=3058421 RepID=A0ABT8GN00_9BACL|nr:amidase family protein [Ureibacillus sp. BA0131]MDN4492785.1 amidase family protein [Ureibacillus sp. BA0131]